MTFQRRRVTPHTHLGQEELFYVLDGEMTYSVYEAPGDDPEPIMVSAGELIYFIF